jgi:hypothetical protein
MMALTKIRFVNLDAVVRSPRLWPSYRSHQPPPLTNGDFEEIGLDIVLGPFYTCSAKAERLRKFESFFGAEPFYCAILWFELEKSGRFRRAPARTVHPFHLLMLALHFLKAYNTEVRAAVNFGCTEQTFRLWTWYMLKGIAKLDSKFVSAFCMSLESFFLAGTCFTLNLSSFHVADLLGESLAKVQRQPSYRQR